MLKIAAVTLMALTGTLTIVAQTPDPVIVPETQLELLPPDPVDTMLFPESHGFRGSSGRSLIRDAVMVVDTGWTVLAGRSYEKRDPSGKYAFDYGMAIDKSGNKAVFYSVSTQSSGKITTTRRMIPLDEMADQPARYAAEIMATQQSGEKSLLGSVGNFVGQVLDFLGTVCTTAQDFVKALTKYKDIAPSWLQPVIDGIIQKAPAAWTGQQTTKMLMPGGANLSTQRLIAQVVKLYGTDYAARDAALQQIASTHLIVTGQASNSPNPAYTAEVALLYEHTVGMDLTKDPRWAPALAAAITAQVR